MKFDEEVLCVCFSRSVVLVAVLVGTMRLAHLCRRVHKLRGRQR